MSVKTGTALGLGILSLTGVFAWAQAPLPPRSALPGASCLHNPETAAEQQRRQQALAMVRLTNTVVESERRGPGRRSRPYATWEELAGLGARLGRMDGGPMGRLAREVRWGASEPLPGWQIHYVAGADGYAMSLSDVTDPCGLTLFGDERGVVSEGYPLDRPGGFVPVDSQ